MSADPPNVPRRVWQAVLQHHRQGIDAGRAFRVLFVRLINGRLSRNAFFALGQSVIVSICLLLTYRLAVSHTSLEHLGLWSLLVAGSALARLGDVSGGEALSRFVAMHSPPDSAVDIRDLIDTVMLTGVVFNTVLCLLVWLCAPLVLPLILDPQYIGEAQRLLPLVLAAMLISAVAAATSSAIDGTHRADKRAMVTSAAALVWLTASWWLVPRFGIVGFGVAKLIQQIIGLVLGWFVLQHQVTGLGWFPHRWRRGVFVEIAGYALKLNAIGVAYFLFEPLAKFGFNAVGGTSLVALYELATHLVLQLRALVISAAMPLLPALAAEAGQCNREFFNLLNASTRALLAASVGVAICTLVLAPVISLWVLGEFSPIMLTMTAALTTGWCLHLACAAFYLAAQAHGVLRWNFLSHVVMAVSVVLGVFLLRPSLGSAGLIAAIVAGLSLSTFVVLFGNARALGAMTVVCRLRWWLLGSGTAIVVLCAASLAIFEATFG